MSSDPDRISVPTNGKRPHAVPTLTAPAGGGAAPAAGRAGAAATAAGVAAPKGAPAGSGSSSPDLPTGLSPQQLAIGFGIVASLVASPAGLARRRVAAADADAGRAARHRARATSPRPTRSWPRRRPGRSPAART